MTFEVEDQYKLLEKYILSVKDEICSTISDIGDDLKQDRETDTFQSRHSSPLLSPDLQTCTHDRFHPALEHCYSKCRHVQCRGVGLTQDVYNTEDIKQDESYKDVKQDESYNDVKQNESYKDVKHGSYKDVKQDISYTDLKQDGSYKDVKQNGFYKDVKQDVKQDGSYNDVNQDRSYKDVKQDLSYTDVKHGSYKNINQYGSHKDMEEESVQSRCLVKHGNTKSGKDSNSVCHKGSVSSILPVEKKQPREITLPTRPSLWCVDPDCCDDQDEDRLSFGDRKELSFSLDDVDHGEEKVLPSVDQAKQILQDTLKQCWMRKLCSSDDDQDSSHSPHVEETEYLLAKSSVKAIDNLYIVSPSEKDSSVTLESPSEKDCTSALSVMSIEDGKFKTSAVDDKPVYLEFDKKFTNLMLNSVCSKVLNSTSVKQECVVLDEKLSIPLFPKRLNIPALMDKPTVINERESEKSIDRKETVSKLTTVPVCHNEKGNFNKSVIEENFCYKEKDFKEERCESCDRDSVSKESKLNEDMVGSNDLSRNTSIGCQTSFSDDDYKETHAVAKSVQTKQKLLTIHRHGRISRATQTHLKLDTGKAVRPARSWSLQRDSEDCQVKRRCRKTSDSCLEDIDKPAVRMELSDQERMFMCDNSPEMQVVVNSSTPVLVRRKTSRRHTHKDVTHTAGAQTHKDVIHTTGAQTHKDVTHSAGAQTHKDVTHTAQSIRTCIKVDENQNIQNDAIIHDNQTVDGQSKPLASQTSSILKERNSINAHNNINNHTAQCSPNQSIIISPEMSRTWHGSSGLGTFLRPAPRMGLGMVSSESTPYFTHKRYATIGSHSMAEMPGELCRGFPYISRSLLDAMHKRFYSSYSNQYSLFHNTSNPVVDSTAHALPAPIVVPLVCPSSRLPLKLDDSDSESSPSTSIPSSPRSQRVTPGETTPDTTPTLQKKLNASLRERREAEIEAVEACKWLRAAGFPQYAQMYEDGQFPIDISVVEKDHDFLDRDSIQSLFRRLNTLNRCTALKIDAHPRKTHDETEDDDFCALSNRWEFQQNIQRWSRKDLDLDQSHATVKSSSSHDSLLTDQDSSSPADESPVLDSKMPHLGYSTLERKTSTPSDSTFIMSPPRLRRAASDRIKSAKNLLRKVESFKTKRNKKFSKNIVEISGPVVADKADMQAKIQHMNCVDISPTSEVPVCLIGEDKSEDSASLSDEMSPASPLSPDYCASKDQSLDECDGESRSKSRLNDSSLSEYYTAHSELLQSFRTADSYIHNAVRRNNSDMNLMEIFFLPQDHKPGSFPKRLQNGYIDTGEGPGINYRTGSFSVGSERSDELMPLVVSPKTGKKSIRFSMYDNLADNSPHGKDQVEGMEPLISQSKHCERLNSSEAANSSHLSGSSEVSSNVSQFSTCSELSSVVSPGGTSRDHSLCGNHNKLFSQRSVSVEERKMPVGKNSSTDLELAAAQDELDAILHQLFENINGLNETIYGKSDESVIAKRDKLFPSLNVSQLGSVDDSVGDNVDDSVDDSVTVEIEMENDGSSHLSSSPYSDQDIGGEELSPDDSLEHDDNIERRERRDSGVGSSLTRTSSERKRKRIRWHSFQKCHRPSLNSRNLQVDSLSVRQLMVLRKLSLLKLTAVMEKYSPTNRTGWNWSMPRFMKRNKSPDFTEKNVFGVPLHVILQRTGQALPQCILYAMRYLRKTADDALGIFRKSGVRSRIQKLRNDLEAHPEEVDFEELQAYDVADLLKQYFRELPECLLTNKLSETFITIFTHVPASLRLEAIQATIVLLPDENRETLQSLLLFLSDVSQHAAEHQMTASNLAVCFAPSLFNMGGLRNNCTSSPKRNRKNLGIPEARELLEQKAAHECLTFMIAECKKIFMIPTWLFSKLPLSCIEGTEPTPFEEFYRVPNQDGPDFKSFGEECIQTLLKESHDKNKGWVPTLTVGGIEILHKKPSDSNPLREWKCCVEVEAPPVEVLNRILHERQVWDEDLLNWSVVEQLDQHADVFQYMCNSMAPHPTRHFCILRYWRTDLVKGACAVISTSVDHPDVTEIQGVRAVELMSHFLMEPCGSGKTRITHLTRTDTRGRSPEWYNKSYAYICANYMDRIRESFHQQADLPETDV